VGRGFYRLERKALQHKRTNSIWKHMLGPQAIFFQQGDYHARLRRLVSRAFSPQAIRASVPTVGAVALRSLRSWDGLLVNTFQEMKLVGWMGVVVAVLVLLPPTSHALFRSVPLFVVVSCPSC
jgi:hypothetical protein